MAPPSRCFSVLAPPRCIGIDHASHESSRAARALAASSQPVSPESAGRDGASPSAVRERRSSAIGARSRDVPGMSWRIMIAGAYSLGMELDSRRHVRWIVCTAAVTAALVGCRSGSLPPVETAPPVTPTRMAEGQSTDLLGDEKNFLGVSALGCDVYNSDATGTSDMGGTWAPGSCTHVELLGRHCNIDPGSLTGDPLTSGVALEDGTTAVTYTASEGTVEARVDLDIVGNVTLICPGEWIGATFTADEYGLLMGPSSPEAERLVSLPTSAPDRQVGPTLETSEVAEAFMMAVSASNNALALDYGSPEAVAAYHEQAQEAGAYLLVECHDLSPEDAPSLGGEVYCAFDGKYSRMDLVLDVVDGASSVVGAYGGFLE